MGYNLCLRCDTCDVNAASPRGEENAAIKVFGMAHPRSKGCRKLVAIDNGYAELPFVDDPGAIYLDKPTRDSLVEGLGGDVPPRGPPSLHSH